MRRICLKLLSAAALAMLLAACSAVMGPDLANRPSPFNGARTITFRGDDKQTLATLTPSIHGDAGVVTLPTEKSSKTTFNAAVTYHALAPASAVKDHEDYWLVGFNTTRTPDRSYYVILRHPHDQPFAVHTRREAEFKVMICETGKGMIDAAPEASDDSSSSADSSASDSSADASSDDNDVAVCVRDLDTVYASAQQLAASPDDWNAVTVVTP